MEWFKRILPDRDDGLIQIGFATYTLEDCANWTRDSGCFSHEDNAHVIRALARRLIALLRDRDEAPP